MHDELKAMLGDSIDVYFKTADVTRQEGKTYYTIIAGQFVEYQGEFVIGGIYYEKQIIPVAHLRYRGQSKTFVTWTITGESPSLCGDDEDLYSTVEVDIDVYSNGNYVPVVKAVKKLFKANNWIWAEDSFELYEEDTGLYHKTISFEKENYIWQE